jgi:hypothetical protein
MTSRFFPSRFPAEKLNIIDLAPRSCSDFFRKLLPDKRLIRYALARANHLDGEQAGLKKPNHEQG